MYNRSVVVDAVFIRHAYVLEIDVPWRTFPNHLSPPPLTLPIGTPNRLSKFALPACLVRALPCCVHAELQPLANPYVA